MTQPGRPGAGQASSATSGRRAELAGSAAASAAAAAASVAAADSGLGRDAAGSAGAAAAASCGGAAGAASGWSVELSVAEREAAASSREALALAAKAEPAELVVQRRFEQSFQAHGVSRLATAAVPPGARDLDFTHGQRQDYAPRLGADVIDYYRLLEVSPLLLPALQHTHSGCRWPRGWSSNPGQALLVPVRPPVLLTAGLPWRPRPAHAAPHTAPRAPPLACARFPQAKYEVDPEYFTGVQSEVTPSMRAVLADWMHSLHVSWGLRPETLYGALQLVDRYLTHHAVSRSRLQLVAIAALMASCKLEEQHPPSLADFAASTRDTYSVSEVRRAEMRLCTRLGWKLRGVSPRTFLARFLDAGGARCGDAQANLTKLYCELALVEARFLRYKPSQICAAAVYAARWQIGLKQGGQFWNPTLERFTGYSRDEVHPIAKELLWAHRDARNSRLRSVVIKYSDKAYGQVSTTFVPLAASGTDSAGNSYPTEFPAGEPTHSCCQQGRSKHR